ncbi:MAG: helix-turn-helix protein [Acidimicrobiales bacterium]|nr:helix-turn-helix protein [Acidimicrobiales bacterium]
MNNVVAAIVIDGLSTFELAVCCEVFGLQRPEILEKGYELLVCAADEPPLRATGGITVDTPYRLADVARADTVVVPAWNTAGGRVPSAEMIQALRDAYDRGARILSVCSGAFALGYAGLLDGRRATTHWMYADRLAAMFPEADVDPDVLYVIDGPVMTSAGTAAGIDLCLHLVRMDHGAEIANAFARRMVVPPHRDGGQAQYVQAPMPECSGDDPIAEVSDWMVTNLHEELSVDELARKALMSPRTFARRFRAATGTTPHQWLLRQRVLHAQHLLEATDEPVERIATRCGFGSAAVLRQHFNRMVGTSPLAYRRTFQCESA